MAKRGEVKLERDNGDVVVLKFGTNAICKIEEELNKSLGEILDDLKGNEEGGSKISMRTLRTMVRMSIQGDHMSPDDVGDLIDEVGFEAITKAFGEVFSKPDAKADPLPAVAQSGVNAA